MGRCGAVVWPSGTITGRLAAHEMFLAATLLLLLPLRAGRPGVRPVSAVLVLLVAPLTAFWLAGVGGESKAAAPVDLFCWDGRRLEQDLLHLQLPAFRRGNDFLARHQFRSGPAQLAHPAGLRVVLLDQAPGRAAWLREGLNRAGTSNPVEVLDAGWEGASLPALECFTREVLLDFAPDLIVLRVSPELLAPWSGVATQRYLERITAADYRRTLVDRLIEASDPGSEPSGAERLEQHLLSFCDLLSRADVDLLLITRPQQPDDPNDWMAGVRRVADLHSCVLIPGPASGSMASQRQSARKLLSAIHQVLAAGTSGRK